MKNSALVVVLLLVVLVFVIASCNSEIKTKINKTDATKTVTTKEKQSNDNNEEFEMEVKQYIDPCFACIGKCKQKYTEDKEQLMTCVETCDSDVECAASKKLKPPGMEGIHYSGIK